jgi:hypothetical protein
MTPMDLCTCVSEECGHEEGVGVHPTLLSGARTETDTSPGECALTKQMDLCACVSEVCGDGEGVCVFYIRKY